MSNQEDFSIIQSGSARVLHKLDVKIKHLEDLLTLAKCPDTSCDGKGTCAGMGPGYDGEADVNWWECQWCAERKEVLSGR